MPSPKTPYANTPPPKPSTNRGIMNQNQRKQLDYLDREAMPTAPPPAPKAPAPPSRYGSPLGQGGKRPAPDYEGMEREAERLRNRKR